MSSSNIEGWCTSQPPASTAESSQGLDFISRLPDCILASIMFLLPFKESVRTSILSSHWRNVWKLAPLRLDDSPSASSPQYPWDDTISLDPWKWNQTLDLLPLTPHQMSFFNPSGSSANTNPLDRPYNSRFFHVLSAHNGTVHSLRLSGVKGLLFKQTVTHLVNTVMNRGIRELALKFDFYKIDYHYQLPLSLFGCGSLQILTLRQCIFPVPAPHSVFPNLKELNLMRCKELNIDMLETVLALCGSLETVQLVSCQASYGLGCVSVSSTSLCKFVLSDASRLGIEELIIEDAPNLEYLMICHDTTRYCDVKVQHARKLQVLGFISAILKNLQLGCDYFVQQQSTIEPTIDLKAMPSEETLSTVKTLAIDIGTVRYDCSIIVGLLGSFPCIENLYINYDDHCDIDNRVFWDKQESFIFLEYHLKQVIINGFRGDDTGELSMVEFARFMVLNGKVLGKIIILSPSSIHPKKEKIQRGICFDKRASEDLQLIFTTETKCSEHVSLWKPLLEKGFVEFP